MQIWSKDERPVRFQVLTNEGDRLAGVDGRWLEVTPMEFEQGTQHPRPGRPKHMLWAKVGPPELEQLRDHEAFHGGVVQYSFDFAGRTFGGGGAIKLAGSELTLTCSGPPELIEQRLKAS